VYFPRAHYDSWHQDTALSFFVNGSPSFTSLTYAAASAISPLNECTFTCYTCAESVGSFVTFKRTVIETNVPCWSVQAILILLEFEVSIILLELYLLQKCFCCHGLNSTMHLICLEELNTCVSTTRQFMQQAQVLLRNHYH
jgi:hypothetical protein